MSDSFHTSTWQDPAFLAMLIENTNDIISVLDSEGTLLYESPSFSRLLGYELTELVGDSAIRYLHSDDVRDVAAAIEAAMTDATTIHEVTFRFRHRDGTWRVLEGRGRRIEGPAGSPCLLVNSRDVTDRAELAAQNRAQHLLLDGIYNESQLPIFVVDITPQGEVRFVSLNPAYEALSGLTSSFVAGKRPEELVPTISQRTAAAIRRHCDRCVAEGSAITYEEMIPTADQETWWMTRLSPLRDEKSRIYRIVGGAYPITDRRKMEAELRVARAEAERRVVARTRDLADANRRLRSGEAALRSLINAITEYAFLMTPDGELVTLNETTAEAMGRPAPELVGQNILDLLPADLAASRRSQVRQVIATGEPLTFEDTQSGQQLVNSLCPVLDANGQVIQVAVFAYDVTDQREAERALRLRDKAIEASISGLAIADMSGRLTYVNAAFLRMAGHAEPVDVIGRPILEFWSDQASATDIAAETRTTGSWSGRQQMVRQDGSTIDLQCTTNLVLGSEDKPIAMMASFTDVTALVAAEAQIAEQREAFLTLLERFPEALYVSDPETHEVLFANQELATSLERNPTGATCYEVFYGRDVPCSFCTNDIILHSDAPYVWRHYNPVLKKHYWITDQIVPWPDGRHVRFEVAVDETDRVLAETALRESEDRYRTLTEASPDMIFTIDRDGTVQFVNAHAAQRLGVDTAEITRRPFDVLLPREVADVQSAALSEVFRTGESIHSESMIALPENDTWLHTEFVPLRNDQGDFTHVMGVSRDITTRKRAEQQLVDALDALAQRNDELSQFNKLAVGREKRMIQLKRQVNDLAAELGREAPYDLAFLT